MVLVARVAQVGDESSGLSHITQPPAPTNRARLENELTQQGMSHHCHTAEDTDLSATSLCHQSGVSKTKCKEVDYPSNSNTELKIFNWNSEGGRTYIIEGRGGFILVKENCPSHWPWPTGRVGPIPFEERLKWAKTQIAFGKHYVMDWAVTGPLERRQREETLGLTNEIALEPTFNSPFDTISASTYQNHHQEVDEAFVRMRLKRDVDPGCKRVRMILKGQSLKERGKRQGKIKQETKDCGGISQAQGSQST